MLTTNTNTYFELVNSTTANIPNTDAITLTNSATKILRPGHSAYLHVQYSGAIPPSSNFRLLSSTQYNSNIGAIVTLRTPINLVSFLITGNIMVGYYKFNIPKPSDFGSFITDDFSIIFSNNTGTDLSSGSTQIGLIT